MLISCALLVGCKKSAQLEERAGAHPASSASAQPALLPRASAVPASSSAGAPSESTPPESEEPKAGSIGDWVDGNLYRFRLESIQRCADAKHADAGSSRFAVTVAVSAKVDNVFISPRALSFEQGGVIVQAELEPGGACGKPLPSKQLKANEVARGIVVIAAPSDDFAKKSKLAFRPTRWGGAPAVVVSVPPCLDACPKKR